MNTLVSRISSLGAATLTFVRDQGRMHLFLLSSFTWMFRPPLNVARIIEQIYFIGVKSILVVGLTAFFTGMVLGLQGYYTLSKFGSEGLLGGAVALTLIRELGPVLAALMITGRAGSSIAAELGSMRISEQIDALDTMNIDPIRFLISPRVTAAVISTPLLTAMFNVVGILGGYFAGVVILGTNSGIFMNSMITSTELKDVVVGMIKPVFFGHLIAIICCYRGFYCDSLNLDRHGTESVSWAATSSVVTTSVMILIVDFILTALLF